MKRAFLGMPGYGEHTIGAGRGFWRASKGPAAKVPIDFHVSYSEGSLLAQNFNALWCQALNECHAGRPYDYFAMLHADIEPQDFWLDILVAELEATGLDVLGVVAPIKDPKGLTSIALERPDRYTWRPLCRLTMHEVYRLPETFTAGDTGYPLLLNTGCWVCRFNPEWARKVNFTINDRIVFNSNLGIYQAQAEPEDWYFSRLCHEQGLKLGATRKVRLDHVGKARYANWEPWGQEHFDSDYTDKSVIPPDPSGFVFPADVDGWLLPSEGKALAELARGKRVLEIGSYLGKSTICLAQTADRVDSIDPHDGRGTPRPRSTLGGFLENLRRYGIDQRFIGVHIGTVDGFYKPGDDQRFRHSFPPAHFDLVFIDGAHDLESVQNDIRYALSVLKPDGLLAFHDYRTESGEHDGRWDAGVTKAVGELIAKGGELVSTHSTLAVIRPPQTQEATCLT